MHSIFKSNHPVRRAKSFQYAFEGIFHALFNEANFRIQLVIAAMAVLLGIAYNISPIEWAVIILTLGSLLSAEMVNTAIEEITDHFVKEISPTAKIVKDLGSGFVLVTAISTLLILSLIFGHRLF
jgi:undecaprenol kinase